MENSNKLEKILEQLSDIKVVLERHTVLHEKNTDDLAEHIRRTDLLETKLEEELGPIKSHVTKVDITIKVIGIAAATLGAILMGLHELGILKKLF